MKTILHTKPKWKKSNNAWIYFGEKYNYSFFYLKIFKKYFLLIDADGAMRVTLKVKDPKAAKEIVKQLEQ